MFGMDVLFQNIFNCQEKIEKRGVNAIKRYEMSNIFSPSTIHLKSTARNTISIRNLYLKSTYNWNFPFGPSDYLASGFRELNH